MDHDGTALGHAGQSLSS